MTTRFSDVLIGTLFTTKHGTFRKVRDSHNGNGGSAAVVSHATLTVDTIVSMAKNLRVETGAWFINISYRDKIEDQYPVEVLDRTDDTLTVRFLSTGSVSIFDHAMIRELPFCKNARRLSRAEATAHWAKPPNYSGASRGYCA
jgi:hypothetical protein